MRLLLRGAHDSDANILWVNTLLKSGWVRLLLPKERAASAEPIPRQALASACAPPFRISAWQVGEAESGLGWCLSVLGQRQEAQ
jgi:hypothetical protein